MPNSAIQFEHPPPIKPKVIRLVLPEEDETLENHCGNVNGSDSSSNSPRIGIEVSSGISSRESELNELELALIEREEEVKKAEVRLAERERSVWEFEALILAREKLLDSQQQQSKEQKTNPNEDIGKEIQALEKLRDEVARQQETLDDTKNELKVREEFVEVSENRLLEKTMQQQEEESRLEQMKEDLDARELRVNRMEGKPPPPEVPKEVL